MNGGISIGYQEAEQVLTGDHNGMRIIVLSVKPDAESAVTCWAAACGLADTLVEAGSEMEALIVDIAKATVRHGYVTEMS